MGPKEEFDTRKVQYTKQHFLLFDGPQVFVTEIKLSSFDTVSSAPSHEQPLTSSSLLLFYWILSKKMKRNLHLIVITKQQAKNMYQLLFHAPNYSSSSLY